jgi:hypothetical protein
MASLACPAGPRGKSGTTEAGRETAAGEEGDGGAGVGDDDGVGDGDENVGDGDRDGGGGKNVGDGVGDGDRDRCGGRNVGDGVGVGGGGVAVSSGATLTTMARRAPAFATSTLLGSASVRASLTLSTAWWDKTQDRSRAWSGASAEKTPIIPGAASNSTMTRKGCSGSTL